MNSILRFFSVAFLFVAIASTAAAQADRKPYFGETHIHTVWSFDAYIMSTRATPDDAYEFAKGKPLKHPTGKTYQLRRPLDFMAVTDHGLYLGVFATMRDESHPLSKHPLAATMTDPDPSVVASAYRKIMMALRLGRPPEGLMEDEVKSETWTKVIESANRHNEPGKFTTLIGYEYTATPNGQNLHRNVLFKGDTAPAPFSSLQSQNPEDLWNWMDKVRADGHELLAIPHNSNLSDGRMFERQDFGGEPFTAEYAEKRMRNEPLVEVTQVKGTSETHPMLSPNDEFADFELVEQYVASGKEVTKFAGSYVRDALRSGLEFQDSEGFNPYKFGMIAASDSHTGIVPVLENDYSGKSGLNDGTPARRLQTRTRGMDVRKWSASGLAGVWAKENTRPSIFDALARKETWGTSSPRITLRFFGGFDLNDVKPGSDGWVDAAYQSGVSMGGELKATDGNGTAPTFAFWAMKDSESGNLDRVQIVKGWSSDGKSQEKVYDVKWSGDRQIDSETGKLPPIGNTVNTETLEYTNDIGAVELFGTWTDPEFNADQNAFYYVRALEIPTPRWSMFDAKELGTPHPEDLPQVIQERAYSSPIWYDHH